VLINSCTQNVTVLNDKNPDLDYWLEASVFFDYMFSEPPTFSLLSFLFYNNNDLWLCRMWQHKE